MSQLDNAILSLIKDKFMSVTEIYVNLRNQGYSVNRNTVLVHINKLLKYGEVFYIIGESGKRGVKPPKFKCIEEV